MVSGSISSYKTYRNSGQLTALTKSESISHISVLLSIGSLSYFLYYYCIVQSNFLPLALHKYHPTVRTRGQIIFCNISVTGSPSTRCG